MTVSEMRAAIIKVYPNATWKFRVERMPEAQVVAIYYKFKEGGKFNKPKKDANQLTVFDYI